MNVNDNDNDNDININEYDDNYINKHQLASNLGVNDNKEKKEISIGNNDDIDISPISLVSITPSSSSMASISNYNQDDVIVNGNKNGDEISNLGNNNIKKASNKNNNQLNNNNINNNNKMINDLKYNITKLLPTIELNEISKGFKDNSPLTTSPNKSTNKIPWNIPQPRGRIQSAPIRIENNISDDNNNNKNSENIKYNESDYSSQDDNCS